MSLRASAADLGERGLRAGLTWLSQRRSLGRLATRLPVTRPMVARFIVGETLDEALVALERLRTAGYATTVDVLGESITAADLAAAAGDRYVATLRALAEHDLDRNVSLKLTQVGLDIDPDLCRATVERVFRAAAEVGAFVRIDMEDHTRTDRTLELWRAARPANPSSGVVIQAALRRSAADLERLIAEGAPVRLCKGAYNEPAAVAFRDKAAVDRAYVELGTRLLREGIPAGARPAFATHDARIIEHLVGVAEAGGIAPDAYEFQMLNGVRRDLQAALLRRGFGVRVYVPYGTEWYPYFMRRLAERPANVAFMLRSLLKEGRGHGRPAPPPPGEVPHRTTDG
ncbi:MAG: proline dehydrogenase family protein [Chloroflexi bacterium]|nr:proline dehydrogenase family protein [Chloroflexota bacterium]